jgi:hypothetical protein
MLSRPDCSELDCIGSSSIEMAMPRASSDTVIACAHGAWSVYDILVEEGEVQLLEEGEEGKVRLLEEGEEGDVAGGGGCAGPAAGGGDEQTKSKGIEQDRAGQWDLRDRKRALRFLFHALIPRARRAQCWKAAMLGNQVARWRTTKFSNFAIHHFFSEHRLR